MKFKLKEIRTRHIFKLLNKLVWDIMFYGLFVFLAVGITSHYPLFYNQFQYTTNQNYVLPDNISSNQTIVDNMIYTQDDDERVVFGLKIYKRIEIMRQVVILVLLLRIFLYYKDKIFNASPPEIQKKWLDYEEQYNKLKRLIRW